ncbi:MAG TPA: ABC transporter permease [Candidatus Polarisedimenticolia bacterium]|nr:ABC transporter permease [Candidatus Polarisedimenticolia bacterium]
MSRAAAATLALAGRETRRFFRERSRVTGALLQPVLFWAFFGAGLAPSFHLGGGIAYGAYLLPGIVVLVLLFTAIFSTISVIEDRREGFLQGVMVAPVPRGAIVAGKILGGTILATAQAGLALLLAPLAGVPLSAAAFAAAVAFCFVLGFGLTSLSLAIAWPMRSTQGFHAIMTVFLMPLWLLSGAFFPAEGVPRWLGLLMRADPLAYGVAALRRILMPLPGVPAAADAGATAAAVEIGLTFLFVVAAFCAAVAVTRRRDGALPG